MSVRLTPTHERRERILAALRNNKMTKAQLCERFNVSTSTMKQTLESLMRDGVVESSGLGRGVTYTAALRAPKESPCLR